MWTQTWLRLMIIAVSLVALYLVLNQQALNQILGAGIVFVTASVLEVGVDYYAHKRNQR